MTYKQLQIAFEVEATSNYINVENKITSNEIEYWLNVGKDKFIKTRYSGINFKREGLDQSQKRRDDLRTLIKTVTIYPDQISTEKYIINELPIDYWNLLGDRVGIVPESDEAFDCWPTEEDGSLYKEIFTDPIQCTIDNIDQRRNNKLSDHLYHNSAYRAKPLRLQNGKEIQYYTDGNYSVNSVEFIYLREPLYIDIHTNPNEEYTDMPEQSHSEIIKLSVQSYLENKANPRYNSINNEVNIME